MAVIVVAGIEFIDIRISHTPMQQFNQPAAHSSPTNLKGPRRSAMGHSGPLRSAPFLPRRERDFSMMTTVRLANCYSEVHHVIAGTSKNAHDSRTKD